MQLAGLSTNGAADEGSVALDYQPVFLQIQHQNEVKKTFFSTTESYLGTERIVMSHICIDLLYKYSSKKSSVNSKASFVCF